MKMRHQLPILVMATALVLTGCGKTEDDTLTTEDSIQDTVEAGVTALAGVSDEQTDATLASYERTKVDKLLDYLNPISTAYAATCSGRAIGQSCVSGVRSIAYSSCTIGASAQTLSGNVSLTYSDSANCDINVDGESVTRTFDYTRTTSWGATIQTFSTSKTDYAGDTYGGGSVLTKTATGYDLEIKGKHKVRTSVRNRARLDLSIKTAQNITFDSLDRSSRTVSGGALEIAHNLAKYKVRLEPNNVVYDASCCYPVGGTLNVTYTGSVTGTGSVTFTSCGQATVTKGADSYDIEFYSCE